MVTGDGCMIAKQMKSEKAINEMSAGSIGIGQKELVASLGCYILPVGVCIFNLRYGPIGTLLNESDVHFGIIFNCLLAMARPLVFGIYCLSVVLISMICALTQ